MRILVLAALTEATGNAVTAQRIASQLELLHDVILADANQCTQVSLCSLVQTHGIEMAIGIHALLAGPFLKNLGIPYALVLGGTDLYEPSHPLHQNQMAQAVASASAVIAFSPENRARAEALWPGIHDRVRCLPQAVDISALDESFSLASYAGLAPDARIVLLPTGIRRVKDPLHAAQAFSHWHLEDPSIHLVVAGAVLEPDYAASAVPTLKSLPGVHYVGALPRPRMLAGMKQAQAVLNTSLSEGMCGAVLEAMALGTPVVARHNAGNASIVQHRRNGMLYASPDQAVDCVNALMKSSDLKEQLRVAALQNVLQRHSVFAEREALNWIVFTTRGLPLQVKDRVMAL